MKGLLVIVEGFRRHWRVVSDDGRMLILHWTDRKGRLHRHACPRSAVLQRREPGLGWVSTRIPE